MLSIKHLTKIYLVMLDDISLDIQSGNLSIHLLEL